jgi:hypothetical protein
MSFDSPSGGGHTVLSLGDQTSARTSRNGSSWPISSRPFPKTERDRHGVDFDRRPPRGLVARAVQFAVMKPTDRDGVFVADFPAEGSGLGEANVMRFARHAPADDARLGGDEPAMFLVAHQGRNDNRRSDGEDVGEQTRFV